MKNKWIATIASIVLGMLSVLPITPAARASGNVVWQVNLKDSHPTNYWLGFGRTTTDDKGQPCLEADSRGNKSAWHSCVVTQSGLLKAGEDYAVVVDYEIVDQSSEDTFFYVFARSTRLGYGADQTQRWSGESGARGVAKLHISATTDDFHIEMGIHNQGAIRILSMKLLRGDGWTTTPLDRTWGSIALPEPPTGAPPFTVDPPANTKGPIVNLADFGIVANGDLPPSTGADRNLNALKQAIAKCREIKASKLIVPKGIYRITSGENIMFEDLSDFTFDGGGSTFLFHQIKGGVGIGIKKCNRTIFCNFNLDWDWKIDPIASVGRITKVNPDSSFFEMRFETAAPTDPKRWETMNPLDEKLRAPGTGKELGLAVKKLEVLDPHTVRVWTSNSTAPKLGQLYLLRHYIYEKNAIAMFNNTHLSLRDVIVFSFPGTAFTVDGDQHHFEFLHCKITYPKNEQRSITAPGGGLAVESSQGFIKLEDCDFGYTGDDCISIGSTIHGGVRRLDDHTLVATNIVSWRCPFSPGDLVEIRNGDFSPTGFSGKLKESNWDAKTKQTTMSFEEKLPSQIASNAILFNHRYGSNNCIIRNCYLHENRARGLLCVTGNWLIEGNRFFHNQAEGLHLIADITTSWATGFGANNVIVRNNTFESCNSSGAHTGSAVYVSADSSGSASSYPLLENLLIENNIFQEIPGPVIEAASFRNLVIRKNSIINRKVAPIAMKMRGGIQAALGSGLWVEDNQWTTENGIAPPSLSYDADTTKNVVCKYSGHH